MKLIGRVALIAIVWALAWGSCALLVGIVGVKTSPDTGHVPHGLVVVIVAFIGTVVGVFSGILYAVLSRILLPSRGRVVLGAAAGICGVITLVGVGAISNSSVANPLMSTLAQVALPTVIGAAAAALLGAAGEVRLENLASSGKGWRSVQYR